MRRLAETVLALAVTVALLTTVPLGAQETPRAGGVFKAAMIGEPPTLDLHTTTAVIVQQGWQAKNELPLWNVWLK